MNPNPAQKAPATPERHKGNASISRWTSSGDPHTGITITLNDETSGTQCVEIHLTIEAFAIAITGGSHQKCEFEWRPGNVGKFAENKEEIVTVDWTEKSEAKIRKALAPFEKDGWSARRSDVTNHHMRTEAGKQRVTFFRFVEQKRTP